MVPALLAEGELLDLSGRDLVTAYVAGYEVWAELIRRDANYHRKGWHPTSIFGVYRRRCRDRGIASPSGGARRNRIGNRGKPRRRLGCELRYHDEAFSCWACCPRRRNIDTTGRGGNERRT